MNAAGDGWLVRSISSLEREYGDAALSWLHPAERAHFDVFRSAERRASWLWGRVVVKRLLLSIVGRASQPVSAADGLGNPSYEPWQIEIRSRTDNHLGIAPTAWINNEQLPLNLSIAHAGQFVAAACASSGEIGIDVVDHAAHRLPAPELWAIKEAAFKCLPSGTSFQPGLLRVELNNSSANWFHLPSQRRGRARLLANSASLLALAWRDSSTAV